MSDSNTRAVYIKPEPGTAGGGTYVDDLHCTVHVKTEADTKTTGGSFGILRRAVERRENARRQRQAVFKGRVWFDDTIQIVNCVEAGEAPGTPKKKEAYDGRFGALNRLKKDFQKRREQWVRATPGKKRPFCYTDPIHGPVRLWIGRREFLYTHTQEADLPFNGR